MTIMQKGQVLYPPLDDGDDDNSNNDSSDTNAHSGGVVPPRISSNFQILKKRKLSHEESEKLALETAQLVHDEVSRLKNSIAELEAVLRGQADALDEDDNDDDLTNDDGDDEGNGGLMNHRGEPVHNIIEDPVAAAEIPSNLNNNDNEDVDDEQPQPRVASLHIIANDEPAEE